jgi:acyl-CoA synthetase (AMP-forming)/AMP-acid ligase II
MKPWRLDHINNVGHVVSETALRMPRAISVAAATKRGPKRSTLKTPIQYDEISFGDLESRTNRIARGLIAAGVEPGQRIALMVPPGIEFVAMVFALFKAGAVVILIDPGMGRKNMLHCLASAQPDGMVGIPLAHGVRLLKRKSLPHCKLNFVVGKFFGVPRIDLFETLEGGPLESVPVGREDPAAIIFTTGSTGPPKGVLYRHRVFIEQAQQIRDYFEIQPGTVDVSGFPLFALFNTAMGTTTIFPEMDPTRPAAVHPPNIFDAVNKYQADQSFGSPALWNTVSKYCVANDVKLPTVKRILSAGAPVPANVLQRIKSIIASDGDAFTPYGATEALPVACNSASVVLQETCELTDRGMGTCVGKSFDTMDWKVIEISDSPLPTIEDCRELPQGQTGELIVRGVTVTDQYVTSQRANEHHKVRDGDTFWHRMGDVGYLDSQHRFWFCGRKTHRVETAGGVMFTVTCEAIFNTHHSVYRSALVGVGAPGDQTPVIIVELLNPKSISASRKKQILNELRSLAANHSQTDQVKHFLIHPSLPVDIRHNSKIFREKLRPWAASRVVV